MNKEEILSRITAALDADLELLTRAARTAHAAATHVECIADNKYDTTGLEASYVAQGQANRAQDIRRALERYRTLTLRSFTATTPIRLTALVTLEDEDGNTRLVFLGPDAGGLKLVDVDGECIVITPESTLGRALLGKVCGDAFDTSSGMTPKTFTIVDVA
ncbi:MAG: transcription elongation factor GreAB [Desulfuromonadales bacterium GWD2_61_12]|nr:MAG: transcription elongation factor GreAB [Desulfuromonadales bacterium GWC2_61_20]OGR35863.1 MAG: transcription elongation factor GreAB [Desulfuromonadales bacterium GWD2_61_12]HBT82565.1 transcription elongation factor GreAB [Desulfuromonas sp.]